MIDFALTFAFVCFGLALLLNLYHLFRAPSLPDRVLVLDTMVTNAIALITLYGILMQTSSYFEASMIFAMTGFVSTVSYSRFMLRGDIVE